MKAMASRKPAASKRLAEAMDKRAARLGLNWKQVAARGGTTYESVRQARNGKIMRGLTEYAIERGLDWAQGSMQAIRAGGEPIELAESDRLSVDKSGQAQSPRHNIASVLDAIEADPHLLPEAKEHLSRQYGLLLRINGHVTGSAAREDDYDAELSHRIAARAEQIRSEPGLTDGQKDGYVAAMEEDLRRNWHAERGAEDAPPRRDPHRDVVFEETLDGEGVPDEEVDAELDRDPLTDSDVQQRR